MQFANANPDSMEITFGNLLNVVKKTVQLNKTDLSKRFISLDLPITPQLSCPSFSYKITQDSASKNAIDLVQVGQGGSIVCKYENKKKIKAGRIWNGQAHKKIK